MIPPCAMRAYSVSVFFDRHDEDWIATVELAGRRWHGWSDTSKQEAIDRAVALAEEDQAREDLT